MRKRMLSWITAFTLLVSLIAAPPVTGTAAEPEEGGAGTESITADNIQVGDYIELGSYNGKPIKWRCIGYGNPTNPQYYVNSTNRWFSDDNYIMYESDAASGKVPLFLADEVICNKAFDAAGTDGNTKQSSHDLRKESAESGSNLWSDSNIRDWLNSDAPAGEVKWSCGNLPDAEHIVNPDGEEKSPYDQEAGFLTNFSYEEQRVMMAVRQKQILGLPDAAWTENSAQYGYDRYNDTKTENISISNFASDEYNRCYYRLSTDTMFLLDVKQADTLYKNCTDDKLGKDYYQGEYFLRSPLVRSGQADVYVKALRSRKSKNIECLSANTESGIRPAFYACETAVSVSGDGSKDNPYILKVPATPDNTVSAKKIKVGDYVEMGTYYGEMIRWRCVGFDRILRYEEDGTPVRKDNGYKAIFNYDPERLETLAMQESKEWKEDYLPIMISEHIITFKPYDAACDNDADCKGTSHEYRTVEDEEDENVSNYWGDSNLRSWLNSDAPAGEVEWLCGNPPDYAHVYPGVNAYDKEAGFLNNFTEGELNAIKEVSRKVVVCKTDEDKATVGSSFYEASQFLYHKEVQGYSDAYGEYLTDKMFCPDAWIIGLYENYWGEAILNECGKPTEQALAHRGFDYQDTEPDHYPIWLSTPEYSGGTVCTRYYDKSTKRTAAMAYANTGYTGVCPVFYLNVDAGFVQGDGTESFPYTFREPEEKASVKTGEYVQMGTYNGEDILWRCVGEDNFGTLMVSDQILSVKPFDASGQNVLPASSQGANTTSHGRGWDGDTTPRKTFGSNYWNDSNIKSWLNSDADAGEVEWLCGNPPDSKHVQNGVNAYDGEAGFLNGFTMNEICAMHKCDSSASGGKDWYRTVLPLVEGWRYEEMANKDESTKDAMGFIKPSIEVVDFLYETYKYEKTYDRVFLLDAKQLKMIYNNRNYLGSKYYMAKPTPACVAQSESKDGMTANRYFSYWLRTPSGDEEQIIGLVQADGSISGECAYNGEVGGIRPAFYMERNIKFVQGEGTKESPYFIDSPKDKAEAEAAVNKINDIPEKIELTEECENKITSAREAYDGLSDEAKSLVSDKAVEKLIAAETELSNLKAIDGVSKSIEAISETMGDGITVDNIVAVGEKIKEARNAYTDLDSNLQDRVDNYDILTAAETAYEEAATVTSVKLPDLNRLEKIELQLGADTASMQLEAEILPATAAVVQEVEWSIDKENIASIVWEGTKATITAKAEGETNLTVKAGGITYECTVSVKKAGVTVERIELSQTEAELDLKDNTTMQLEALVVPVTAENQSLQWSIDMDGIVTMDVEGNKATIIATAEGEATVTVSSTAFPAVKAECKITVKAEQSGAVPKLVFADAKVETGKKITLTPKLTPENTPVSAVRYRIVENDWILGENASSDIISIDYEKDPDGGEFAHSLVPVTITGKKTGTAYVWVEVSYDSQANPLSAICEVTVTQTGGTTGPGDAEAQKTLAEALAAAEDIYEYGSASEDYATNYTPDTWKRFKEAYEAAKNPKEGITPEETKALADAVDDARKSLALNASEVTENAEKALLGAMSSNTGNFEDTSWSDYQTAHEKLKEAVESGNASAKDLIDLQIQLNVAEKRLKADAGFMDAKKNLTDALAVAESYLGKQEQYGQVAWEEFMAAYDDAKVLSEATKATADQRALEEKVKVLNAAVTKLTDSPAKPGDPTAKDPTTENPTAKDPTTEDPAPKDPTPKDPAGSVIKKGEFADIKGVRYSVTDVKGKTVSAAAVKINKKNLTKVAIPDTVSIKGVTFRVTEIKAGGFKKCARLTKVTLGKNVVKIGNSAFEGCSKLTSLTAKATGKVNFGKKSFYNCKKLGKVTIKAKKPVFGKKAFFKTKQGAAVTLSKGIKKKADRNNIKKALEAAGIKKGKYKFK